MPALLISDGCSIVYESLYCKFRTRSPEFQQARNIADSIVSFKEIRWIHRLLRDSLSNAYAKWSFCLIYIPDEGIITKKDVQEV